MNTAICTAIKEMNTISFTYDGQPRTVEPHAYGVSTAGKESLRAFQTAGRSNSGNAIGWHMFSVGKIINLSTNGDSFSSTRPGYKKNDKGMTKIHCQL
ncbi:MAG: hypothetical protein COA75_12655 [Cellvibrionales bacterium]|nr:MAG: hypothetical protein COA75_12655 [Cellvibrionales bacterium]